MKRDEKRYLGGDRVMRPLDAHLAYLECCAKAWEQGVCCKAPAPVQAARVRAMARRIKEEAKP
jgi:hypothetical protein